jgi:hypothetical protein
MKKIKFFLCLLLPFLSISIVYADVNVFNLSAGKYQGALNKFCDQSINISATFQKLIGGNTIKMLKFDGQPMSFVATATNHTDGQYIYDLQAFPAQKIGNMKAEIKSVILGRDYATNSQKLIMTIYLMLPDAPPFAQHCQYVS